MNLSIVIAVMQFESRRHMVYNGISSLAATWMAADFACEVAGDSVLECFEHSELECSRYVTEQTRTESGVT